MARMLSSTHHKHRRQREEDLGTLSRLKSDFLDRSREYRACNDEDTRRDLIEEIDFILDFYRDTEVSLLLIDLAEAFE